MIIGIPKEIKAHEYRVSITPWGAGELKKGGHTVLIENGAGEASGFSDGEYLSSDADIVDKGVLFQKAELIVKVKEPLPGEYPLLREGQAIFTYLHLAANPDLTRQLLQKKIAAFAYETLQKDGTLPLLAPMSEIAGRMAPLMGSYYLQRPCGGRGVLSAGAVGIRPAKTVILGAGVVGTNAARVARGIGMETVVLNRGMERLTKIDEIFMGMVRALPLTAHSVAEELKDADIVIGAVLVPGAKPPLLITRHMLREMRKGSVIVDVSIDQGGCAETSRPTTHDNPVYEVDGILHYTVANMPGAYPRTSTLALTNATLPYITAIASLGIRSSVRNDSSLKNALNTYAGYVVHNALAGAVAAEYRDIGSIPD